jgi:acyl-CoA synthetase (AMP-forming)/AMP-acid ligase II
VGSFELSGKTLLIRVEACSFYGLTPVLLPYNLPHPKVYELINATAANGLVCAAGNLPLEDVAQECTNLRLLTWVVEKSSRHMDWHGVPESAQNRLTVSVWHDVVEETQATAGADLPTNETGNKPEEVITIWQPTDISHPPEIVPFTQRNIVSAIAALISALPLRQRLSSADLVLPANSFHIPYVLCQTLAALYQHASLAITSVAQPGVDLSSATRSISPTVIIASAETLATMHAKETADVTSAAQRLGKYSQAQTMSAGRMPTDGLLFRLLAPSSSASGNKPGTLRLILTAELLGAGTPPLSSTMLSDLRIFTRARICYGLCTAKVAGAVAQTHVFDYRRVDGTGYSHFGVPLSSVEVWLVDKGDDGKVGATRPEGEIVVAGPAVAGTNGETGTVGAEVRLEVRGRFGEDGCLSLA